MSANAVTNNEMPSDDRKSFWTRFMPRKEKSSSEHQQLHQGDHNSQTASDLSTNTTTEVTASQNKQTTCKTPLIGKTNSSNNSVGRFFRKICCCCCCCCCGSEENNKTIENCSPSENNQAPDISNNENDQDDDSVVLEVSDSIHSTSQIDLPETKNEERMGETCLLNDDDNTSLVDRQSEHSIDEIVHDELSPTNVIDNGPSIHDQLDDNSNTDMNMTQEEIQRNTSYSSSRELDIYEGVETGSISEELQAEPSVCNTLSVPDIDDDTKEKLIQEYARQKAYYDTFPDLNHKTRSDIKKAEEFTNSILDQLPSGVVSDRNTACHVLNNLFRTGDTNCLFFDSSKGMNLHDAFQNAADYETDNRPIVLQLSSSEGLGNIKHIPTPDEELKLAHALNTAIEQDQSHPVLDDIIERLARVHGVRKEDIVMQNVFTGTLNGVYTVRTPSGSITLTTNLTMDAYQNEFPNVISVRVHPVLDRPSFDISMFDPRGNKTFPNIAQTFNVGPCERPKLYTQPAGWTRYGLKALGKYDNNYWLDPFQHPDNWYRAFHGTGRAQSTDFGMQNQTVDPKYAPVDAIASIYDSGFRKARIHAYGPGVYCSPDPKFPERGYVRPVSIETAQGRKSYKCMIQVAVRPDGVTFHEEDKVWVVADPKNIRPYGILIKEA